MKVNFKLNQPFLTGLTVIALAFTSCTKDKNSPGYEYMPDMYRSPAYKAGEPNPIFADGKTNQEPVSGTIVHSFDRSKMMNYLPYPYANTPEGLDLASANNKNPLQPTEENIEQGKHLYEIYCAVCHGDNGEGDGSVVKVLLDKDNYGLQPPAYSGDQLKNITEGQIYHAIHYGKGNMGSYASQLSVEEAWKVVFYVQQLQKGDEASSPTSDAKTDLTAIAKK